MKVYLIDASALVIFFLKNPSQDLIPAKARISKLFASWRPGQGPVFYVPNFCMAECSKAFATIFMKGKPSGEDAYRKHVDALLNLVSGERQQRDKSRRQRLIQTYKLKRPHLVDIEDVFMADRRLPLRDNETHLSGLDGLIIAMGRVLRSSYKNKAEVFILTAEKRMANVCRSNPEFFPSAICIVKDEIPGT